MEQSIKNRSLKACVLSLGVTLATLASSHAAAQMPTAWTSTRTHAHPVGRALYAGDLAPAESVGIVVALKPRNEVELDALVDGIVRPQSASFRHYLTREEVVARFAPTVDQARTVANYLSLMGFSEVQVADNRMLVSARGTADAIRKALNVRLAHFSRDGRQEIANTTDVQVPQQLGNIVDAVLGLQTLDKLHPVNVTSQAPLQFAAVYDASALPAASNTVVGIIAEGSLTQTLSDLSRFEIINTLPALTPTVVNAGVPSGDLSGTDEWDLDSQDILGAAGGQLGGMIFYSAASWNDSDIAVAFNRAVSDDKAKVVNASLGYCEAVPYADGVMTTMDRSFKLAIAQGQTFSVSSGDNGAYSCGSRFGNGSYGTILADLYPASSPYVIAVGGTTLSTNGNGTYAGETTWAFGGGGPSLYEAQPSWQAGIVPGTKRGVPDLAFDADPASGASIVLDGTTGWVYGGTSLSSPIFVGAWARLESQHGNNLGFPGAWLYSFGVTPPASMFHDVTVGSNGFYNAGIGWDYATGFGSLDVAGVDAYLNAGRLATDLVTSNNTLLAYYVGQDMNLYQAQWGWPSVAAQVTGVANRPIVAPASGLATYMNSIYNAPEVFYLTAAADGTQHIEQLWGLGNAPTDLTAQISTNHPAQPAESALPGSSIVGFIDSCAQTDNLFYVGANHHVELMTWAPVPGWTSQDLTMLTVTANVGPGTAAGTALIGHVFAGNSEEVFYIESDNHVHELWRWSGCANGPKFDGWHNTDVNLANLNGSANVAVGGALAGFYDPASNSDALFYVDVNGALRELTNGAGAQWTTVNVSATAAAAAPQAGTRIAAHVNNLAASDQEVFYLSGNNVQLVTTPSATPKAWRNSTIGIGLNTVAQCPAAAPGSPLATDIDKLANSDELYYISAAGQPYQLWPTNGTWACVAVTRGSEAALP